LSQGRLLTIAQGAAYLAISIGTLRLFIKEGRIPYIPIKSEKRVLLADLDAYILQQSALYEKPTSREFKLGWTQVCKLLDLDTRNVSKALKDGKLKDFTEPSVRAYIIKQVTRTLGAQLRKQIKHETKIALGEYRDTVSRLRKKLGIAECSRCGRKRHDGVCNKKYVNLTKSRRS